MSIRNQIQHIVDVKSDEKSGVKNLLFLSFLGGVASAFYFVAASTHFIKKTPVNELPLAYILSGVVGLVLISFYKRYIAYRGIIKTYILTQIVFSLVCIALYISYRVAGATDALIKIIDFAGYVLIIPFFTIFALNFATLCSRIFNLAQSKRLLGLIGMGEVIASLLGYFIVPFLVSWVGGTEFLLPITAVLILLTIIPITITKKLYSSGFTHDAGKKVAHINYNVLVKDRYYMFITIVTMFSVFSVFFTDYTYILSVKYLSAQTGYLVASIIAVVSLIMRCGDLVLSLFSGNIISKRGMQFALLLLPASLVFTSLMAFGSSIFLGTEPLFILVFLFFSKFNDRVLRRSINNPATRVLYQVAKPHERVQLQTVIDGVVNQVSTIVAGGLLYVLTYFFSKYDNIVFLKWVSLVCIIVFVLWVIATQQLYHQYKIKIHSYLSSVKERIKTTFFTDEAEKTVINHLSESELKPMLIRLMDDMKEMNEKKLIEYISYYHPAFQVKESSIALLTKKIIYHFYLDDNYFSRILLIKYIEFLPAREQTKVVREIYDSCDLSLRLTILQTLNKTNYKINEEDSFAFLRLTKNCVAEIAWTEAAIFDTELLQDEEIYNALQNHKHQIINILLGLLQLQYESSAIEAISKIINLKEQTAEDQLFAVELLDNTLTQELKPLIIPVFENISYHAKKVKWQNEYLMYNLPATERLKEILLRDYKLIHPAVKEVMLKKYYELTKDKFIVKAFIQNKWEDLSLTADALLQQTTLADIKSKIITAFTNSFALINEGYMKSNGVVISGDKLIKDEKTVKSILPDHPFYYQSKYNNVLYKLDALGMAILLQQT
jgi:hypothetical protein